MKKSYLRNKIENEKKWRNDGASWTVTVLLLFVKKVQKVLRNIVKSRE